MNIGEKIIVRAIELAERPETLVVDNIRVREILRPFILHPEDLDLRTICTLEALLNEKLLIIPTKQQWRKIKLEHLNNICDEKEL